MLTEYQQLMLGSVKRLIDYVISGNLRYVLDELVIIRKYVNDENERRVNISALDYDED